MSREGEREFELGGSFSFSRLAEGCFFLLLGDEGLLG